MIIQRLRAVLSRDEGCELEVYEINGIPHIGYGVNLIAGLTDEQLEYLGVEDEDDIHTITQEQADWLLDSHIEEFTEVCEKVIGDAWEELSDVRKEVLLNVALNVGSGAFPKFRKAIQAVKDKNWKMASAQLLDSRAAKQTGERYTRLAKAIETGDERYFEVDYNNTIEVSLEEIPSISPEQDQMLHDMQNMQQAMSELFNKFEDLDGKIDSILELVSKTKKNKITSSFGL